MVLLLEGLKHTTTVTDFERVEWPETIFNYFTGQVFGRLSAETRDFLLRTAMLPQREDLRSHYQPQRRTAATGEPLLPAALHRSPPIGTSALVPRSRVIPRFLDARAQSAYSPADWKILLKTAADALVSQDRTEEAVPILMEAGAWDGAVHSILTQAQGLLDRGRGKRCSTGLSRYLTLSGTRRHG